MKFLPNKACMPSCPPPLLLSDKAARALKISGAPLPYAKNVTP